MPGFRSIFLTCFVLCAIACGTSSNSAPSSDSDGGDAGPAEVPDGAAVVPTGPANEWASFIDQWCQIQTPCCAAAGLKTDREQCKKFFDALYNQPDNPYDPATGNECLVELRRWAKTSFLCGIMISNGGPSCVRLTPRKGALRSKKPGETCKDLYDCASSPEGEVDCVNTETDAGSGGKICQIQVVGKNGDGPCVGLYDGGNITTVRMNEKIAPSKVYVCDRQDHLRCDATTRKCMPARVQGEACDYDCDAGLGCLAGHCAPPHAMGESCADASSGDICTPGLVCSQSQGGCIAPADDGKACIAGAGCKSMFCDGKVCKSQSENPLRVSWCGK
ncbi:hypothetical protein BH11MYX4_BH11MYX4_43720 [soil metagenome]